MSFLTLEQISALTHAPLKTVQHWVYTRKLPAFKPGRHVLVKEADFKAFVEGASLIATGAERVKRARARARAKAGA